MALIEIDGLPIKNTVIFHGKLLVITRWYHSSSLESPKQRSIGQDYWELKNMTHLLLDLDTKDHVFDKEPGSGLLPETFFELLELVKIWW